MITRPLPFWARRSTALGAVAVAGRGRLLELDAAGRRGLVETGSGGVVERLVAATGDVVHDADRGATSAAGVQVMSSPPAVVAVDPRGGLGRARGGVGRGRRGRGRSRRRVVLSPESSLPQAAATRPSAAMAATLVRKRPRRMFSPLVVLVGADRLPRGHRSRGASRRGVRLPAGVAPYPLDAMASDRAAPRSSAARASPAGQPQHRT